MMDLGLLVLTPDRKLVCANARARALLGCSGPEELEQRWEEFESLWEEPLARLAADPFNDTECEGTVMVEHQRRRFRLSMSHLDSPHSAAYILVIRDLGRVDALETDLLHASQLRGLAYFCPTLAHDLKGPLNTMALNLELLHQSVERPGEDLERSRDRQRRYVAALQQEVPRMNRAVESFLGQIRPALDARERFDLREVLQRLDPLVSPKARLQHVTVRFEVPEEPVFCNGYSGRLRQALVNVIVNALEMMPSGGQLTVSLRPDGQRALISVRDCGAGLSEALVGKMGALHFTTKEHSTGIGLYTARSVVQSHGGAMTVHTEVGQGTCFEIDLPCAFEET